MKVSLNWIREFTDVDLPVDELVEKIGAQLGAVEEVVDLGKHYQDIKIAKVVSCQKHPNADKLNVCNIDIGGQDTVQVVCGAPNVRQGLLVAWIPPDAIVPSTYGKDPLVLEAREIRGEVSNGMLASVKELAIGDDHSGIVELDQGKPGDDFAEVYKLNDFVIDIENKMFTHRPDCFGILGVAREIAGVQQKQFKSPNWYNEDPEITGVETEELKLEVINEIPELVPRFTAITLRDVRVGPSPLWLQIALMKLGVKSINNLVDYGNYLMFVTGQPSHIWDYDKVKALSGGSSAEFIVRLPKKGEKITLLNGKTIEPDPQDMIIATDKTLICLGGAMGGKETEVSETTKNIIIEAASWDMYTMRRTSMSHGIFTDAVTRFTKGQSTHQNKTLTAQLVEALRNDASGKVASELIDLEGQKSKTNRRMVEISAEFINARLGLKLTNEQITKTLKNVEFETEDLVDKIRITVPFWRTDIAIAEDVVEEVGRLYGYDNLPLDLPRRNIVPAGLDKLLAFKQAVRSELSRCGASEVLTYSFIHNDVLEKVGQDSKEAYRLTNALSPDLQYYRLSLTPSLLAHVHQNVKAGYENFALFELGKVHSNRYELEDGVPKEIDTLACAVMRADNSGAQKTGAPFYEARRYLDHLAKRFGVELMYYPVERDPELAMPKPFNLKRSAFVAIKGSKGMLGIVGEYSIEARKNLKLPCRASGFEIGVKELLTQTENTAITSYQPLSRYPGTKQDICLQVKPQVRYVELKEVVVNSLQDSQLEYKIEPVDIYSPEDGSYKNITFRVSLTNTRQTITTSEAAEVISKIGNHAKERLGANVV